MAIPTDRETLRREWDHNKPTLSEPAKSDFEAFVKLVRDIRKREIMYEEMKANGGGGVESIDTM